MPSAMRRHANVRAGGLRPRHLCFPDAEGPGVREGTNHSRHVWARRGWSPAGWSTMARTKRMAPYPGRPSPLLEETPVSRRAGAWSPTHGTLAGARVVGRRAQKKRPPRGRPPARGTGAVADGGRESEGCRGAMTSGNGVARRTRPSPGGPCWCELLGGPLSNALTLIDRSPGPQEVVGRMTTSHISGGAGWWTSPCPDLVRGRVRATARPTLQTVKPLRSPAAGFSHVPRLPQRPCGARSSEYAAGYARGKAFSPAGQGQV
jgi:hypothetical protein